MIQSITVPGDRHGRHVRFRDFSLSYREGALASRYVGDVQLVLTRSGNRALGPVPGHADAS